MPCRLMKRSMRDFTIAIAKSIATRNEGECDGDGVMLGCSLLYTATVIAALIW
jgi:hypothetical protein